MSPKKKKNVPIYLLVVDDTSEFRVALQYTARLAKRNGARLALLHVVEKEEFQHWGSIQNKINNEIISHAENILLEASGFAQEISGHMPVLYLESGGKMEVILDIIKQDPMIEKFILGGSTSSSNAGPLVSYFSGKGLVDLRVPLTIVPDTVEMSRFSFED